MKVNPAILGACTILLAAMMASGCVTENVRTSPPRYTATSIFEFPPPGTPPAGCYHGVSFFFEVDADDLPEIKEWMKSEKDRLLPPIIPESAPDGREVYRIRDLHRVDYHHSMFEAGGYRYPRMPNARLYVFKRRPGNFSFAFRGQGIVVPSDVPWTPSIYYYSSAGEGPGQKPVRKETVQVGLATIETVPQDGTWLVNGRQYYPDRNRPLELPGAVHATVPR